MTSKNIIFQKYKIQHILNSIHQNLHSNNNKVYTKNNSIQLSMKILKFTKHITLSQIILRINQNIQVHIKINKREWNKLNQNAFIKLNKMLQVIQSSSSSIHFYMKMALSKIFKAKNPYQLWASIWAGPQVGTSTKTYTQYTHLWRMCSFYPF